MKLKSIRISGFKSFADRTIIVFHDGITGVIGPNGSGKSNIIDAVRWVMGEQTAKSLRADDPADIIFSGSQNRKSISFVEVTLVFSNDGQHCPSEFMHLPEISICRRMYRDGKREYFLNGEACRFKDIVDFLLAIGLGSKSYSIIQQDKRDRIIQASPEDLREILEETAGISVFKVRRKEAEKRLESTAEKLNNLTEIETELSRQKESLREQVEKATQKIELTKELKEKEMELVRNHVGFYRSLCSKIKKEIDFKNAEIQQSVVETIEWETKANDLKSEHLELTQQIKSAENELDDHRIALTKYQERSQNYKFRFEEQKKQQQHLENELVSERENLKREEERKSQVLIELDGMESELKKIDGRLEALEIRREEADESFESEQSRSEEMRSEMRAIETMKNTICTKNSALLESISKYNQNLQKITESESQNTGSRGQLIADRSVLLDQLGQISKDLDKAVLERSQIEQELNFIQGEFERAKQDRDSAKEKHLECASLFHSLQKILESNSGLSDGTVLLKEKLSKNLFGFLFDHVSLHKDDELILESSIPELFQSALVENIDKFIDILDKAEELDISRIHLLTKDLLFPLSVSEKKVQDEILSIPGIRCVGKRLESIKWAPAAHLLEKIFICKDEWILLKAKKICGELHNFIFITERGAVCEPNGNVYFGRLLAEGETSGILQRKREFAQTKILKEQLESQLASKEGALFLLSERKRGIEEKISHLSTSLEKEKIESIKFTSQIEHFDLQISHIDENLNRLKEDKKRILDDISVMKEEYGKNLETLDKLTEEYQSIESDFSEFELMLADKKALQNEITLKIQSTKSERAVISERGANNRKNYEEICFQIKRMQQKVDGFAMQIETLKEQVIQVQNESEHLTSEMTRLEKQVKTSEAKLEHFVSTEDEIAEQLRVLEGKLKSQKDWAAGKQKFITEKQLELARCETILETALNDAFEKFGLAPEQLPYDASNDTHLKNAIEQRIKELNKLITELGAVNERAVDEFKDVNERLIFLLDQKQDIERSIQELNASIHEIEETTKIRFKEIFDKVNVEFQKIFPVLFPGGHGELHMLNEEDLLTTGVEILVRLPGKKMQNMSLFSGGEKALTAISLIFSLLKTTPAPFCFLDEVDAPLDEANVGRFNDVLEALSGEFQFVVITHNRRTMEILDTIYGISMSEPGVSKLVSVDLSDVPPHLRKKQKAAIRAGGSVVETA